MERYAEKQPLTPIPGDLGGEKPNQAHDFVGMSTLWGQRETKHAIHSSMPTSALIWQCQKQFDAPVFMRPSRTSVPNAFVKVKPI